MNVAIIGASTNRSKYGNKAVRAYLDAGHKVFPVNNTAKKVEGLITYADIRDIPERVARVAIYTNPKVTYGLLDGIAEIKAREVFFNPGSESDEVIRKAEALGLNVILACSILAVRRNPADYGAS